MSDDLVATVRSLVRQQKTQGELVDVDVMTDSLRLQFGGHQREEISDLVMKAIAEARASAMLGTPETA